jgi:hypothetical protein
VKNLFEYLDLIGKGMALFFRCYPYVRLCGFHPHGGLSHHVFSFWEALDLRVNYSFRVDGFVWMGYKEIDMSKPPLKMIISQWSNKKKEYIPRLPLNLKR